MIAECCSSELSLLTHILLSIASFRVQHQDFSFLTNPKTSGMCGVVGSRNLAVPAMCLSGWDGPELTQDAGVSSSPFALPALCRSPSADLTVKLLIHLSRVGVRPTPSHLGTFPSMMAFPLMSLIMVSSFKEQELRGKLILGLTGKKQFDRCSHP